MSLDSALQKWFDSPAGKKKVAEARKKAQREGRSFGRVVNTYGDYGKRDAEEFAYRMQDLILQYMPVSLRDGVEFYPPAVWVDDNGQMRASVTFKEESLHRESLDPTLYPFGVDNIVMLFTKGWDTGGKQVWGEWHGYPHTKSKTHSDPNPFMQQAVDEFNRKYGDSDNVYAILDYQYK